MMLPLSRVKELDQSCIRFLIKQPGDTLKQKVAANDFKMMGIARVEKYDLLENRVLKDFLYRAQRECENTSLSSLMTLKFTILNVLKR